MYRKYEVKPIHASSKKLPKRLQMEIDRLTRTADIILESIKENDLDQAVHCVMLMIEDELCNVLNAATFERYEATVVDAEGDVYDDVK